MLEILLEYRPAWLAGLWTTARLVGLVWAVGLLLGGCIGATAAYWPRSVGVPARIAAFLFGGIPAIALLFWLHYPAQALAGVAIDPFITATVALGSINVFTVAELVRSAVRAVPSQYLEAARVCGVPPRDALLRVQLPLVLREAIPGLLFSQVGMLHLSLFASLISVDEVFRMAQRINAIAYRPVEIYSVVALLFLAVSLPLNGLAILLKAKYGRDISER